MQKKLLQFFFAPSHFRPQKISAPLLSLNLQVNPIEKHVNSIFIGKFVVIFFQGPPFQGSQILGPPFCISPLTSVCEWSLI